jgi:hypothetical protein
MTPRPEHHALATATGNDLTQRLLEAPVSELPAALGNPALEESQVLLLLRRPDLNVEIIETICEHSDWIGSYLVKAALVGHAHTPKVRALNLVKFLFWRDLARIIGATHLLPPVRRMAEVVLKDRLHEISLGERITLARLAPREVIKSLRLEHNTRVVQALLENPKLTEEDVMVIANGVRSPPALLTLVARADRWMSRRQVRLAIVRNPRTPAQTTLPLLAAMTERDLAELLEAPNLSSVLRRAAHRVAAERKARGPNRQGTGPRRRSF